MKSYIKALVGVLGVLFVVVLLGMSSVIPVLVRNPTTPKYEIFLFMGLSVLYAWLIILAAKRFPFRVELSGPPGKIRETPWYSETAFMLLGGLSFLDIGYIMRHLLHLPGWSDYVVATVGGYIAYFAAHKQIAWCPCCGMEVVPTVDQGAFRECPYCSQPYVNCDGTLRRGKSRS